MVKVYKKREQSKLRFYNILGLFSLICSELHFPIAGCVSFLSQEEILNGQLIQPQADGIIFPLTYTRNKFALASYFRFSDLYLGF